MIDVNITSCSKGGKNVLGNVSFSLGKGEVLALLGPSGAGKSTVLRVIAGLEGNFDGEIAYKKNSENGQLVPQISMIFQSLALWPHMTARKNIEFAMGSKNRKNGQNLRAASLEFLKLLQLGGLENRFPHTLSGGEQQRLAIARALASTPELLLMDEPFSSLDDVLKLELMNIMLSIKKQEQMAIVYVTHSIDEALFLADRIAVLSRGEVVKIWDTKTAPQLSREVILDVLRDMV